MERIALSPTGRSPLASRCGEQLIGKRAEDLNFPVSHAAQNRDALDICLKKGGRRSSRRGLVSREQIIARSSLRSAVVSLDYKSPQFRHPLIAVKSQACSAIALPDDASPSLDAQRRLDQHNDVWQFVSDKILDTRAALAQVLDDDGKPFTIRQDKRALAENRLACRACNISRRREGRSRRSRALDGSPHSFGKRARCWRTLILAEHGANIQEAASYDLRVGARRSLT